MAATDEYYARAAAELRAAGCAAVAGFLTAAEVAELKAEMGRIVAAFDPAAHPCNVFTTDDEKKHVQGEYFYDSADKVRVFYEEGAFDEHKRLQVPIERAVNKVGHGVHVRNDVFRRVSFSPKIQRLAAAMRLGRPRVVQGMYIFKPPQIGGSVTPHTDSTFLHVEPAGRLFGLWFALDEATEENGCLWYSPGSHNVGSGDYRWVRTSTTEAVPDMEFVGAKPDYDSRQYVPAPAAPGTCVLIDGGVWHKSAPNRSDRPRHAWTLHLYDAGGAARWSERNWLQEAGGYKFPPLYDDKVGTCSQTPQ